MATALVALACGGGGTGNEAAEPTFTSLTLVSYPGGFGGSPAGPESTCDGLSYNDRLAVDGAPGELSFDRCELEAPNVYTLQQGQRPLTQAERDSVDQTLAALVTGTSEWQCGADAGFLTLDVQEASATERYISASSCPAEASAGRTLAAGISELWAKLHELSQK